jgi:hypothetical protein
MFEHSALGRMAVATYTPGTGWSRETPLEPDEPGLAAGPLFFVDARGVTNLVWEKKPHSTAGQVRTSARQRDGSWTQPLSISQVLPGYPESQTVGMQLVQINPSCTMFVWGHYDGEHVDIMTAHHY